MNRHTLLSGRENSGTPPGRTRWRRGIVSVALPLALLAGVLGSTHASAQDDPADAAFDRSLVVDYWQTGGAGIKRAAEQALLGSDEDIHQFLTKAPEIEYDDDYIEASRIFSVGGVAVREATKKALKGTPEELNAFLYSGWKKPLEEDREVEASRVISVGGVGVQEAGKAALKAGPEAVAKFLETGQYEARKDDNEVAVSRLISVGGPNVKAAGKAALRGTPDDIVEFLEVGQFVARNRDQEHATIAQLTAHAQQAGVQAESATKKAEEASARAVAASQAAKEAAATAARETAAAGKDATTAAYKAEQAAASARSAAAAAQTAIGAAGAANRAARTAALAAAQTANAAAAAATAANDAYTAAIAAGNDAGKAEAAKKAAAIARNAAIFTRTSAAAAEQARKASLAAITAADASRSAGVNANAAASSAEEANRHAEAAGVHSAATRNAAAEARRHADVANRAADSATALARRSAQQALEARDAANSAADHAEKAAEAAELAAKYAGQSATAAADARKWASAAKAAADTASDAVKTAKKVHQLALDVETQDYHIRKDAAIEQARSERSETERLISASATVARDARALDTTAKALALEAAKPDEDAGAIAVKGRKLAMDALKLRGPWHQQAAAIALGGSDGDVLEYLRNGWTRASLGETRDKVLQLSVNSPYPSIRQGAVEALKGTPQQIADYYTNGQYTVGQDDLAIAVSQINSVGGDNVKEASKKALADGSGKALATFLEVGQYPARITDEEITATRLIKKDDSELDAAAMAALAGTPQDLHEFVTVGRHTAARKDALTAHHRAQVARMLAEGEIIAANAQVNRWRAAAAAAEATDAEGEAKNAAAQAKNSEELAKAHAAEAKKSADTAAASSASANRAAATARQAAAAADRDADAAEASAARAEFSADYARESARKADDAAARARASAVAAGKSKAEAEASASLAWLEVQLKREAEIAEAKRLAEEAQKEKAKQEQQKKKNCRYKQAGGAIYGYTCEPPADISFGDIVTAVGKGAWEFSGAADIKKCIDEPAWGGCAMAAVGVLPVGKLKIAKKAADKIEELIKNTRAGRSGTDCAVKASKHSFPAGTRVLMGDRTTRPIEQVGTGDYVLATNPESGATGPRRVDATIYTPDDREFTDITLDRSGASLTTTGHHPFWAENAKRWKDAADLTPQDVLRTPAGTLARVNSVRHWSGLAPAYNLTVNDLHTYYVLAGETPVLVHNCNGRDPVNGGLDDDTYDRIDGTHGPDVADGVDYQVQRMHDGSSTAADHDLPGIGHDPDGLASYFASWRGKMTHTDTRTGSRVAYDSSRGVLIVTTGRNIHGFRYSKGAFESGRYVTP
ncbi:polymorphic toxin-type HINT domain-containing protein [Streptomyces sp. NPDC057116]|uniref:polymorphic toxin-type HINT domain-containing protein n=1 Tax=Streptomyces sp. NPDC057116 TaxID=3346023 RepID=UPI003636F39C